MYKQAAQLGLRFQSPKGSLTVEQLFGLSLSDLDNMAVTLSDSYEKSKGKSFLEKRTTKDAGIKLQFDIVLDVLRTKQEEADANQLLRDRKENNQKIMAIIESKKDEALQNKSIKELEKLLQ